MALLEGKSELIKLREKTKKNVDNNSDLQNTKKGSINSPIELFNAPGVQLSDKAKEVLERLKLKKQKESEQCQAQNNT
jgi:hypothetical protein